MMKSDFKSVTIDTKVMEVETKNKEMEVETKTAEVTKKLDRRNPSRVRDHLANERTYLAWIRSGIALMGFGVVIVRLRQFQPPHSPGTGWKLGLVFSLVGLVTVLLSTQHYLAVRRDIDEDTYEPRARWLILFSLALVFLGAGVIYYVFTAPLTPLNTIEFN